MTWLTFDGLDAVADAFDDQIASTPEIDHFCSSSTWVLPAARSVAADATPFIYRGDAGFVAMMLGAVGNGYEAAMPLEFGWGLAAPFAGPDPDALAEQLAWMWAERSDEIDALLVSGVPIDGVWMGALTRRFLANHRVSLGPASVRRVASLEGGVAGFLDRRSARFRANLRRAGRRRIEENICLEYHPSPDPESVFHRILEVEAESWKGRQGEGFNVEPFQDFYRRMLPRLARRSQLRVLFLQRDGLDLAFIMGAVVGMRYRGLQVSFREGYESLSLGNVAQLELIHHLVTEGVSTYDLGQDMDYKRRWGEASMVTRMVAISRQR